MATFEPGAEAAPLIEALDRSGGFIGALEEFRSIAATIARARAEIARLAPGELHRDRLAPSEQELAAVARDTETATHAIMNAAETIAALSPSPAVEAEVTRIFEACAFQDITGQRMAKVIAALSEIETRMARFAAAMGLAESGAAPAAGGPGLLGPYTDQSTVDAVMAARAG